MSVDLAEFWTCNDGHVHKDDLAVDKIMLIHDGKGPMGMYDRIHVFYADGSKFVMPAHNAAGWTEMQDSQEDSRL